MRKQGVTGQLVMVGDESEHPHTRCNEVAFRGDVDKDEYVAFWLRDQRDLADMNVQSWDLTDTIPALVRFDAQAPLTEVRSTQ